MPQLHILTTTPEKDYELIDSGDGEKLERYGSIILSRPDPQALWKKYQPEWEWKKAVAVFSREQENQQLNKTADTDIKKSIKKAIHKGNWILEDGIPQKWQIEFGGFNFWIKPTLFKHTGLFPEQRENWAWIEEVIVQARKNRRNVASKQLEAKQGEDKISVLNLFGYTGGATLAAAKAGAEVVHIDGSKVAVTWARENAEISGLSDKPIRWIVEDARSFVEREIKRGNTYDGIIMDPPAFGHGPHAEIWKIEEDFLKLLDLCKKVLNPKPLFILINGYASGYSSIAYENNVHDFMKGVKGTLEIGELTIQESRSNRLLPSGIYARWKADL